jgi:HSP20 family protein
MADREKRPVVAREPFFPDPFESFPSFPRVYSRDFLDAFWGRGDGGRQFPAIDVAEDDSRYVVTAELPGAKREDVTVELHEGALTIRGEKRSEREDKGERRRIVERSFGAFSRTFSLPPDADPERVGAAFKEGVLTVTIGKRAESKPRTVDVKPA